MSTHGAASGLGCTPLLLLLLLVKLLLRLRWSAYLASVREIALHQHVQVWQLELHHGAEAQQRPAHELGRVGDEGSVQQKNSADIEIPHLPRVFVTPGLIRPAQARRGGGGRQGS